MTQNDQQPTSQVIERYRSDFTSVLPSHMKSDQWLRVAVGVIRRNQKLADILHRNPASILAALMDAARLGLEIGDTYHLVPFGNEAVGITDYTGLIELMYRAGAVSSVKAEVVYQADEFTYHPGMPKPEHMPDWFGNRGEIIGAYAYAEMKDGSVSKVVVRSMNEIEKVRATSAAAKSKDSPWNAWPDRMALKTVVKELAKFVPTSAEFRAPTERDQPASTTLHAEQVARPVFLEAKTHDCATVDPETGEVIDDRSAQ